MRVAVTCTPAPTGSASPVTSEPPATPRTRPVIVPGHGGVVVVVVVDVVVVDVVVGGVVVDVVAVDVVDVLVGLGGPSVPVVAPVRAARSSRRRHRSSPPPSRPRATRRWSRWSRWSARRPPRPIPSRRHRPIEPSLALSSPPTPTGQVLTTLVPSLAVARAVTTCVPGSVHDAPTCGPVTASNLAPGLDHCQACGCTSARAVGPVSCTSCPGATTPGLAVQSSAAARPSVAPCPSPSSLTLVARSSSSMTPAVPDVRSWYHSWPSRNASSTSAPGGAT